MFSPSGSEWISCFVGLSDQEMREGRVLPLKTALGVSPGWKAFIILLVISLLVFSVMALLVIRKTRGRKCLFTFMLSENIQIFFIFSNIGHISPKEHKITSTGENTNLLDKTSYQTAETTAGAAQTSVSGKTDKDTTAEKEIPDWERMLDCKVAIRPAEERTQSVDIKRMKVDKSTVTRITCGKSTNETGCVHVLCKEKICSGRYYWEITALTEPPPGSWFSSYECPSSWYAGVTNKAAWEKKQAHLSPENDFWILQYEKDKGYYVNNPSLTPVLVRDRFSRLGVFIDCERQTLSFYDCDKKSHLYTFYNVDCTQPLIPVLSPGDKPKHTVAICEEKCVKRDELYPQQDVRKAGREYVI